MAGFDDWIDMCDSTITHAPIASRDAYGKETIGSGTAVRAKVSFDQSRAVSRTGEDIPVSARCWCPPPGYTPPGSSTATPTFATNDQLTLPDGATYTIVSIDVPYDTDGAAHHQKVSVNSL